MKFEQYDQIVGLLRYCNEISLRPPVIHQLTAFLPYDIVQFIKFNLTTGRNRYA